MKDIIAIKKTHGHENQLSEKPVSGTHLKQTKERTTWAAQMFQNFKKGFAGYVQVEEH